ncbi:hypothetical protein B7755_007110 [Streptomyces sp. NBS 14/10]|uniref:hypothetical protein n=1 Tax=Streptomyces sp. NBS 14/10 TaxID=1945643 RepID=UPI000B7E3D49|nr:hypothetical protein [Streptomyces sp. NBS 14/10]KAK1177940.1 hypothetical protein B7755_007110 [Streptomyces sp. NBS 14/10]
MAFHINQGSPNPLSLEPGANASFTIEVYVDGDPVDPGEIIQVKLPEGLFFPPTGEIRYMKLDEGINQPLSIESREGDGSLVRFKAEAIGIQPGGFYSVNVQTRPNAAPGDRTIPDGLTIGTTTAQLSFRISAPQPVEQRVYGIVASDGSAQGSGFTSRRVEGRFSNYEITFTNPFVSPPVVVATGWGDLSANVTIASRGTHAVSIYAGRNGAYTPVTLSFIAIGLAQPTQ